MDKLLKWAGVVALVIAITAVGLGLNHGTGKYGALTTPGVSTVPTTLSGGSVPSLFSALEASESFLSDGPSYVLGVFGLGGYTVATSIEQKASIGSCNTASSTAFVVTNPFAATSTAQVVDLVLGQQATSTTLYIGTTTKSSGLASTDISASLANAALQATSSQAFLISGVTAPLGSGQISSGSGSISRIVVGPSESIAMYATSTYGGGGAQNYTPSTCSYKLRWEI